MWDHDRNTQQMVNRNIKESLNLVSVKVHGNQTVDTCYAQQVGYQFRTDRHTRFVLAVLTSPSEVRNYGNDTLG